MSTFNKECNVKIESGKYYRTRDGRKVGPVYVKDGEWVCDHEIDGYTPMWNLKTGVANFTTFGPESDDPQYDLIAEWVDEHETPKLWRDMTPEEKGALLLAHHEGKVIERFWGNRWLCVAPVKWLPEHTYRVRPEPVRETVTLYGNCDGSTLLNFGLCHVVKFDTHRITFDLIDGKPDCDSIRMEEL